MSADKAVFHISQCQRCTCVEVEIVGNPLKPESMTAACIECRASLPVHSLEQWELSLVPSYYEATWKDNAFVVTRRTGTPPSAA